MLLDQRLDRRAAFNRRIGHVRFDRGPIVTEKRVLDYLAKPLRVFAALQMKQPRFIVDPFGHLQKDDEVLRPQVEFSFWSAEIKAAIGPQIPLGVLAAVSAPLRFAGDDFHDARRPCFL